MRKGHTDYDIEFKGHVYDCCVMWSAVHDNFEIERLDATDENGDQPDEEASNYLFETVHEKLGRDYFDHAYQD